MLLLPLPLFLAEIFIFFSAIQKWGFFPVAGAYLAPCLLGLLMLNLLGRFALVNVQKSLMQSQVPNDSLLHSAAFFVSGVLFLVPAFFTRVVALGLLLPGTRHLAVGKMKKFFKNRVQGFSNFSFGSGSGYGGGFRYYDFRTQNSNAGSQYPNERPVSETNILDVKPIEIIHEAKKGDESQS